MSLSRRKRFEILKRDGFRCVYCGTVPELEELRVDHVHPRAKGGTDDPGNLVTSCNPCNSGKSDVLLDNRLYRRAEVVLTLRDESIFLPHLDVIEEAVESCDTRFWFDSSDETAIWPYPVKGNVRFVCYAEGSSPQNAIFDSLSFRYRNGYTDDTGQWKDAWIRIPWRSIRAIDAFDPDTGHCTTYRFHEECPAQTVIGLGCYDRASA